jgi:hypothetical protein
LIRHGVDYQHLLTGYRAAQNVGCRRWLLAAAEAAPPEEVAAVADFGLVSIYNWVDGALELINRQIERERGELMGGVLSRRLETVTLIVDGAPIREDVARRISWWLISCPATRVERYSRRCCATSSVARTPVFLGPPLDYWPWQLWPSLGTAQLVRLMKLATERKPRNSPSNKGLAAQVYRYRPRAARPESGPAQLCLHADH